MIENTEPKNSLNRESPTTIDIIMTITQNYIIKKKEKIQMQLEPEKEKQEKI